MTKTNRFRRAARQRIKPKCNFDGCAGCIVCMRIAAPHSPKFRRAIRQPTTPKCTFDGCTGCHMCKQTTPLQTPSPFTPNQHRETPTRLSYADVVTGSPQSQQSPTGRSPTGTPRSRSTDDVTTEQNENSDNLLTQEVNATNEMTILSPQQSITTTTGPLSIQSRNTTRNKWTKDQRLELFRCYVIAINLETRAGHQRHLRGMERT